MSSAAQNRLNRIAAPRTPKHPLRPLSAVVKQSNNIHAGDDIFTQQHMMGHSSLDMVRHYLNLVQNDVKNAHRRANPGDKFRYFSVAKTH